MIGQLGDKSLKMVVGAAAAYGAAGRASRRGLQMGGSLHSGQQHGNREDRHGRTPLSPTVQLSDCAIVSHADKAFRAVCVQRQA